MRKVLLTGESGFIGNCLINFLLGNNLEVISLIRSTNNHSFQENKLYKKINFEINKNNNLNKLITKDVDGIIHLAWGDVKDINSDSHINFSLPAHYNFLSKIIESGVKNIFVLGTCFEYGIIEGSIKENVNPKPVTKYGLAKLKLFNKLTKLQTKYDFNLTWGRLFYVYGDGQKSTIYSQLKDSIRNCDNKFNMSEGNQKLDYLSIHDVCDIITKLFLKNSNLGRINICSGNPIKLWRLVNFWIKENNSNIILNRGALPKRSHEPLSFWGDKNYLNSVLKST